MKTADRSPPELTALLSRLFDGALTGDEFQRLEQILLEDPAAREIYQTHARVHALLHWRWNPAGSRRAESGERRVESECTSGQWPVASGQKVESGEWREEGVAEFPEIPHLQISKTPNLQIPRPTPHVPLPSSLSAWAFSYSVATVLTAIALLGAWFSTVTHPNADSLTVKNSRGATSSVTNEKEPSQFTFVGRVSGMVDCQWSDEATATSPGAAVALNRRYALKSGLMELTYDSGAKVILQGPCEYTIESVRGGYLKVGKLVARVGAGGVGRGTGEATNLPSPASGRGARGEGSQLRSQSALTLALSGHHEVVGERGPTSNPQSLIPNPLFSVRTPTALVEDLGTEFGVEVLQSGETASHVFEGKVVMRVAGDRDRERETSADNQRSEILLSTGQSGRIDANGKHVIEIPFSPQQFTRRLMSECNQHVERQYIQTILADKPLGYWPLNENVHAVKFHDISGNGHHGCMVGVVYAGQPGPLERSKAVEFGGNGYIRIGRQDRFALTSGFSVEGWAWIKKTNSRHVGRIISAGSCDWPYQQSGWGMGCIFSSNNSVPRCCWTLYRVAEGTLPDVELPIGQWVHVACSFDVENNLRVYIDGNPRVSLSMSESAKTGPTWVAIGWGSNSEEGEHWHGRLAHIAVYDYVLKDAQIRTHYQSAQKDGDAENN
jgi:hypothetical protein